MKKIVCVIPARLKSSRFPRKMLTFLKGKPLLQWVWEAANKVELFDKVVFATDSEEIGKLISNFDGEYLMTSESCPSGTDRLCELQKKGKLQADIWVNWQGDEPFINQQMIHDLLQTCDTEASDVWTLKKKVAFVSDVNNPHMAKVVCDSKGYALYMSRSPIPYYRDSRADDQKIYYKHVGLYAFSAAALSKIAQMQPCYLEEAEQLEGIRWIYNQLRVRVHETEHEVFGIDLPEHLVKAEAHVEKLNLII